MANQADIDAITQKITGFQAAIGGDLTALAADVTAIRAALGNVPAGVDITALQAATDSLATNVTNLGATVGDVTALVPTPTPPPAG